jgi:putative CocE/NonD family hydrolase
MFNLTIEVPLRDGTILRGLHYTPDTREPAPVVFGLTPYGAERMHPGGVGLSKRGYHFVVLDSRGRGDSDGEFVAFEHEGADGHDAVEWLARQPWSTGDVVMYSGSYCGFVQWAVAATRPDGLRAIAPAASVYPGGDAPAENNVPLPYFVRWLTMVHGRRTNHRPFEDERLWFEATREQLRQGRSMRDLDLIAVGQRLPVFQKWLDHPEFDEFWAALVPSEEQYRKITIPVLTVTGQYDDGQGGALRFHAEHVAAAGDGAHDVIIGPWDHAGTRTAEPSFGGLTFAESSALDLLAVHADWYDWVLGRGERPELLADRVLYFHAGEDTWHSAPAIPQGVREVRLYPVADAPVPDRHWRGLSTVEPSAPRRIELYVDPKEAAGPERDEPSGDVLFTEARPLLEPHESVTVHLTEPLAEPLDLTGRIRLRLTLSSELPDFDLMASVYVVAGNDSVIQLGRSVFRARYRDSLREASAWPAGQEVPVRFGDFPFVSRRIPAGDRLALVLRPPHREFQVNFQAGGVASDETIKDAVAGTIRVLAGCVSLPVMPAGATGGS